MSCYWRTCYRVRAEKKESLILGWVGLVWCGSHDAGICEIEKG